MGTAQISLVGPAVGQLNPLTGQFALPANFQAVISVPSVGISCTVQTGPQVFSTDNSNVYGGVRFPNVATGGLTGGAIAGGWTWSVPASCGLLGSLLNGGPGSLWLSTVAPPALGQKSPATAKVVAGKSVAVGVTVTNTGGVAAKNVIVCAADPKSVTLQGPKCQTVSSLAAGASTTVKFTFKASKKARRGSVKVTFTTNATDVTAVTSTSIVKVSPPVKKK
jgi:uncharacterized repeat protein (TIGR01451 family)